jgi:hypothetical protein
LPRPPRAPETSLYAPIKAFLEAQGYVAKGEVCGCDIVATRAGEPPILVIAELKMTVTLELLLQGVDRMASADAVFLAVQASRKGRDRDRRIRKLCRLLGFGLLAVTPGTGFVEVLAGPEAYRPRADGKRRARLLREHARRKGDPTAGGRSRGPIMTAYRQQALACAAALRAGPQPVRALRAAAPEAGTILLRNVYGWFERTARGVYGLTEAGRQALAQWEPVAA